VTHSNLKCLSPLSQCPNAMSDLPSPGTRLRVSGNLGTVKFAGSVENTTGIWLGVEWDDPQRGKHDGVKDGKRYFTCRYES
jgi:tubulin-specific chaperone E